MSLSPEDDLNAAEYALGTLDAAERAEVAARRQREADLDQAIVGWELRLAPLAEAIPPAASPRDFLGDIEARLGGTSLTRDAIVDLTKRLRFWRASAVAAGAIAAALAIGIALQETTRLSAPHQFVAILQKSADQPAFVVTVNLDDRSLTVRPVAAPPQADKSYELWIIDAKLGAPRSLGVIDQSNVTANPKLQSYDPAIVQSATYAVTIEPPGGSPTGQPSGAPVFVGKLIPTGP
ncbi:MAG TPA: anti-sigma factor [Roseiarcus sp.]|nr:anti-sigma factor [Roseiarcus sp.]